MPAFNQAPRANGYQQITGITTVPVVLTVPAGTAFAIITPEGAGVRYRDDGPDPTPTVGYPLNVGEELVYDASSLTALEFVAQGGTATLNVLYYR